MRVNGTAWMPESTFLGIDGGGTTTRAVLIDDRRHEIARAASGPSNYHSVGRATAEASLREVLSQLFAAAGVGPAGVKTVGLGMAGVARPDDRRLVRALLAAILPGPQLVMTHDAETALVGGTGRRHGVVLIAGTGAIAYGVNARGDARRADGWGYLLGDDGSAYWIGREGLRAVARACDGRGRPTALQDLVADDLGLREEDEPAARALRRSLVGRVYAAGFGVPQLAAISRRVEQAAREGDAVAGEILHRAGQQLGRTLCAVIRGLEMAQERFETVLAGGVLRAAGPVRDTVVGILAQSAPYASAIAPRHDAAFGAAILAQQHWIEGGQRESEP